MEIDIENSEILQAYLRGLGRIEPLEKCAVEILKGGVSNKTIVLVRENGEQWVIKQALTKLRVKRDWFCDPGRLEIEFKGMQWLSTIDLKGGIVPKPIFFDRENYILIMEAIPLPHDNLKTLLLNGFVNIEWINNIGALLGSIHAAGDGSDEAKHIFGDKSFFKVLRLEAYYQFTSKQLPKTKDFFDVLIIETLRTEKTVVHGDFSPKNILVNDNRLVLLDHEVMHFGDPAFDVGFFLCHLLSKANHIPGSQDKFLEAAGRFWKSYVDKYPVMGDSVERRAVKHTIACLLARCKGRSPLEYLTEKEQHGQIGVALELIESNILEILELIEVFKTKINNSIYD